MKLLSRIAFAAIALAVGATARAQLPSATLTSLTGESIESSTLSNDGKPFVISFFATWCKPCMRELKAINEQYADWQDETGMKLVAISIDEAQTMHKVRPLVDSEGWEYEVYLDPNSDFARQMGVQNVPHLIILDGQGKIVESHPGYTDGAEEQIIDIIRQLSE